MTQNSNPNSRALPSALPRKIPGPRGGQRADTRPTPAPVIAANQPEKFGHVDADGVVWLHTDQGDRRIGQFAAGTPEEGLKHFGARYDDLSVEIGVLEARLSTHPEEAARIREDARTIRATLPTAAVLGDIPALDRRLAAIEEQSATAEQQVQERKAAQRAEAVALKEDIAAEAEKLAQDSTDWKAAGDRMHALFEQWRGIRRTDRATDDTLWARFSAARDTFSRRRGAHFAELDRNRDRAEAVKESLIEKAEAIMDSTDWATTAQEFRDLMNEWKAAGRAKRERDDALWTRFKAAQDRFFDARKADLDKRDAEFEGNAAAKQQLLDDYDAKINPAETGLDKARRALHELQEKWEAVGFVPRGRVQEFEDKIAALESRITEAADAEWRRTDPEALARVAQFEAKAEKFSREAEEAEKKGRTAQAATLREQAAQWKQWAETASQAVKG